MGCRWPQKVSSVSDIGRGNTVIVIRVELASAISGETTLLNSLVIDNQSGDGAKRDYRVRSYRKNLDPVEAILKGSKPTREGFVRNHSSDAESVLNLVSKALIVMGYHKEGDIL